jgi:hypothetical protein
LFDHFEICIRPNSVVRWLANDYGREQRCSIALRFAFAQTVLFGGLQIIVGPNRIVPRFANDRRTEQ